MAILRYNLTLLLALTAQFMFLPFANAAEGLSVSVTPLTSELSAKPGDELSGSMDIQNQGESAQTYYLLARDFTADPEGESGQPLILEQTPADYSSGLASWLSLDSPSVTIEPKATKTVRYHIAVPTDAEPGGHYGVLFASIDPPSDSAGSRVDVGGRVGSLILLTVLGKQTVSGQALDLIAVDGKGQPRAIFQTPPINLKLTTRNDGSIHLAPKGTVTITRSGKEVASTELNPDGGRVLPRSSRTFTSTFPNSIGYGRFTATVTGSLNAPTGEQLPIQLTTSFWVLPLTWILLGLVLLGLCISLFRFWLKHHDAQVRRG